MSTENKPTVEQIMRLHRLTLKLFCRREKLTENEYKEMNSLEKQFASFDSLEVLNSELEQLKTELEKHQGSMPLELVDRSRELLKQQYESEISAFKEETKSWMRKVSEQEHTIVDWENYVARERNENAKLRSEFNDIWTPMLGQLKAENAELKRKSELHLSMLDETRSNWSKDSFIKESEITALKKDNEVLKTTYLHSDDNYYWTKEAFQELQQLRKENPMLKNLIAQSNSRTEEAVADYKAKFDKCIDEIKKLKEYATCGDETTTELNVYHCADDFLKEMGVGDE